MRPEATGERFNSAEGWARVGLASWWGNGLRKAMIRSWSERMISLTGTETRPGLPREGSSKGNIGQWGKA